MGAFKTPTIQEVQGTAGGLAQAVDGEQAHDTPWSVINKPVLLGGVASSVYPVAVAADDIVKAWHGLNGAYAIAGFSSNGGDSVSNGNGVSIPILNQSGGTSAAALLTWNAVFNGTTWDRQRGNTTGTQVIGGNAHDSAVTVGNLPVLTAGVANSVTPVNVTNGDVCYPWLSTAGAQVIAGVGSSGADATANTVAFLPSSSGGSSFPLAAVNYVFNGTSWDRQSMAQSTARIVSAAASVNNTSIKNSAGILYGASGLNTTGTILYLKFYNVFVPTVGTTTPILTVHWPAGGSPDMPDLGGDGLYVASLSMAVTTGVADTDTGAVGAGAFTALNVIYK